MHFSPPVHSGSVSSRDDAGCFLHTLSDSWWTIPGTAAGTVGRTQGKAAQPLPRQEPTGMPQNITEDTARTLQFSVSSRTACLHLF